jgi:hypothetical protein
VVEGFKGAGARGEGNKNGMAPAVGASGADIKGPLAVLLSPRRLLFSGAVDDHDLAWGVDGAGGEIVGGTMEAVPGRDRGI